MYTSNNTNRIRTKQIIIAWKQKKMQGKAPAYMLQACPISLCSSQRLRKVMRVTALLRIRDRTHSFVVLSSDTKLGHPTNRKPHTTKTDF